MKTNGSLKAVTVYGLRDWESALPAMGGSALQDGYVPLRKQDRVEENRTVIRLSEQGLSEVIGEPIGLKETVQKTIDSFAAQSPAGRISPSAEVLARWEIPLPQGIPAEDSFRFCELAYQYIVRTAAIEYELCGIIDEHGLEIWFIPVCTDGRGQLQLASRGLMSRNEYLSLYEDLKGYLHDELGYVVDVDADDVMFKNMGYTEIERRDAIAERENAKHAAQEMGDKFKHDAKDYAEGLAKSFRRRFHR